MKKLFLILAVLFTTSFVFAGAWKEGEQMVDTFYQKGEYIKYINGDDVRYIPKSTILYIQINDDGLYLQLSVVFPTYGGRNNNTPTFSPKLTDISIDDNGNIIVIKK